METGATPVLLCLALLLSLSTINHQLSTAFAQGSLTPPGAPAPTMKTLTQIEPRIPIGPDTTPGDGASVFTITNSGSYYLTTNVYGMSGQYGLSIVASHVIVDLNGFALIGATNGYDGVVTFSTSTNVTIRNGTVTGWGAGFCGLRSLGRNAVLEKLVVGGNGFGILCNHGSVVRDCVVNGNQRDGIDVSGSGSLVVNNTLAGNNQLAGPGNGGLSVAGAGNRIEGNHITGGGGGFGIIIFSGLGYTNNVIVRNSVGGLDVNNYSIDPINFLGPLLSAPGIITNNNPWANFSF